MINTDSRLFSKLTDSEYYLLSVLADYGKTSCPDNDVLMKRTNWGIQKLQATKKTLVSKGFLEIKGRTDKLKGGKTSNEYIIKTNLISKFNGKKNNENQIIENRVIEIQIIENRIVENQIVDNQLIEKQTDLYLLRESFIKNIKQLLKEKESIGTPTQNFEVPKHEDDENQNFYKSKPIWLVELESFPIFQKFDKIVQDAFLEYCQYREQTIQTGGKPKVLASATVRQNVKKVEAFLLTYPAELVAESLELATASGTNSDFNPIWVRERREKANKEQLKQSQKTDTQQPMYELPNFQTPKQREAWFFAKYNFYCDSGLLENRLINTEYRRQAYEKRQPEALVLRLESEFPKLLELNFKNEQWQTIQ